jgi:DNA polymerase elongation subunit (family B)
MRSLIVNGFYTTNPLTVHLIVRNRNGKETLSFKPEKPYLYVEGDGDRISLYGIQLKRVEVDIPSDVIREREKYDRTYEADIPFVQRVLIDKKVHKWIDSETLEPCESDSEVKFKRVYLDIETDDTKSLEARDGEILSISMRAQNISYLVTTKQQNAIDLNALLNRLFEDTDNINAAVRRVVGKEYSPLDLKIISVPNEAALLEKFIEIMQSEDFDIVEGYNIGDSREEYGFDIPYIASRMRQYGLRFSWNRLQFFDLYLAYRRYHENDMESYSLEAVSTEELHIGKIEHHTGIMEMFQQDIVSFISYAYRDTLLYEILEEKLHIFEFFYGLAERSGSLDVVRWNKDSGSWSTGHFVETLVMYFIREHNLPYILPTHKPAEKTSDVRGAQVFDPSLGIFMNVLVLDFKSMYPRLIISFNLSPDAIITERDNVHIWIDELGIGFKQDQIGIYPQILTALMQERDNIKDEMQHYNPGNDRYNTLNNLQRIVKEFMNSFYGTLGSPYSSLYDQRIQEAITYLARNLIHHADNTLQHVQRRYGDTDSLFVSPDQEMTTDEAISFGKELEIQLNASFEPFFARYNNHMPNRKVQIEFEKLYSRWLQLGKKKRYAGLLVYKGKKIETTVHIMGMESRRSDRSRYSKALVPAIAEKLLKESQIVAYNFYVEETERWKTKEIPIAEIGIPIAVRSQYKNKNYQPYRAVQNSLRAGLKLDQNRGKFLMYYLNDDVYAFNYDEPIPKKYVVKIDWQQHKRRCFDLILDDFQPLLSNIDAVFDGATVAID